MPARGDARLGRGQLGRAAPRVGAGAGADRWRAAGGTCWARSRSGAGAERAARAGAQAAVGGARGERAGDGGGFRGQGARRRRALRRGRAAGLAGAGAGGGAGGANAHGRGGDAPGQGGPSFLARSSPARRPAPGTAKARWRAGGDGGGGLLRRCLTRPPPPPPPPQSMPLRGTASRILEDRRNARAAATLWTRTLYNFLCNIHLKVESEICYFFRPLAETILLTQTKTHATPLLNTATELANSYDESQKKALRREMEEQKGGGGVAKDVFLNDEFSMDADVNCTIAHLTCDAKTNRTDLEMSQMHEELSFENELKLLELVISNPDGNHVLLPTNEVPKKNSHRKGDVMILKALSDKAWENEKRKQECSKKDSNDMPNIPSSSDQKTAPSGLQENQALWLNDIKKHFEVFPGHHSCKKCKFIITHNFTMEDRLHPRGSNCELCSKALFHNQGINNDEEELLPICNLCKNLLKHLYKHENMVHPHTDFFLEIKKISFVYKKYFERTLTYYSCQFLNLMETNGKIIEDPRYFITNECFRYMFAKFVIFNTICKAIELLLISINSTLSNQKCVLSENVQNAFCIVKSAKLFLLNSSVNGWSYFELFPVHCILELPSLKS
ncbi:Protein of unknown function [Gryllus bimaculatus]|nr:Protein of unknown function [Gryllus bimaculatus]